MTAVIKLQGTSLEWGARQRLIELQGMFSCVDHVEYSTCFGVAFQYGAYTTEISTSSTACVGWHMIIPKLVAFLTTGKDT